MLISNEPSSFTFTLYISEEILQSSYDKELSELLFVATAVKLSSSVPLSTSPSGSLSLTVIVSPLLSFLSVTSIFQPTDLSPEKSNCVSLNLNAVDEEAFPPFDTDISVSSFGGTSFVT